MEGSFVKRITLVALALLCVALVACDGDPKRPRTTGGEQSNYKNLTEKWHVLHNLRQAYNDMDSQEFEKLLDADNFEFFFYEGDVGGIVPASWGYAQEMAATQNLLGGAGGVDDNPVLSVEVILFDIESVAWEDGDDPADQKAIVVYDFFMDTSKNLQFITSGAPTCEFTVRQIDGKWKLITWRDLGGGALARSATGTEETTWGVVKARYQPPATQHTQGEK